MRLAQSHTAHQWPNGLKEKVPDDDTVLIPSQSLIRIREVPATSTDAVASTPPAWTEAEELLYFPFILFAFPAALA